MTVKVLFFSLLRDLAGTDQLALELPAPSTLGDAVDRLGERFPPSPRGTDGSSSR